MQKVFLHILKTYSSTIKFFKDNKEIFCVSTSECLSDEINIVVEDAEPFKIFVYPHNTKKYLPFSFDLNLSTIPCSHTELIELYVLPENNVIIKFLPLLKDNNSLSSDIVEISDKKLKRLTFLNDIVGRAKVEVYNPNNALLEKEDEYFVYTNKIETKLLPETILLNFFQSIYANDFTYAQNLLDKKLSDSLSKDAINEFFGKFKFCKLVNYYSISSVVLFYEKAAKVYACNVVNNKISDIFEIN